MSPYRDPDKQREYNRNLYHNRYQQDPEFRAAEAFRKKYLWYNPNQPEITFRYRLKRSVKSKLLKVAKSMVDTVDQMARKIYTDNQRAQITEIIIQSAIQKLELQRELEAMTDEAFESFARGYAIGRIHAEKSFLTTYPRPSGA